MFTELVLCVPGFPFRGFAYFDVALVLQLPLMSQLFDLN